MNGENEKKSSKKKKKKQTEGRTSARNTAHVHHHAKSKEKRKERVSDVRQVRALEKGRGRMKENRIEGGVEVACDPWENKRGGGKRNTLPCAAQNKEFGQKGVLVSLGKERKILVGSVQSKGERKMVQ